MNLSEALNQYLGAQSASSVPHNELNRFIRWAGPDRLVAKLSPPDVAGYAEGVAAAGGEVHSRLSQLKLFLAFLNKQGLLSQTLAPHVKIPKVRQGPAISRANNEETITLTPRTYQAMTEELRALKDNRVVIAEKLRTAAADKDFRENAPLEAAREEQGKMEARVREVEATLRNAMILDPATLASGKAQVGSRVTLQDLSSGKEVSYTLVDSTEADPLSGKLSVASPVGQAIIGSVPGDEVEAVAPKGVRRYRVATVKE